MLQLRTQASCVRAPCPLQRSLQQTTRQCAWPGLADAGACAAGADNKQQLKFPFVACEVFCCEVDAVLDALLESARHLNHLFSLLAGPPPLNSVLAGYFARILTALLIKRPQVCQAAAAPAPSPVKLHSQCQQHCRVPTQSAWDALLWQKTVSCSTAGARCCSWRVALVESQGGRCRLPQAQGLTDAWQRRS